MEEKDMMPVDKWVKRAKKLKEQYTSYDVLKKDCQKHLGSNFFELLDIVIEKVGNVVVVGPANYVSCGRKYDRVHPNRDVPIYIFEDNVLKYLDRMSIIKKLVPVLKKYVDQEMMMKDFLEDQDVGILFDLKSRLLMESGEKKKAKISKSPECYKISIGGKRGAPLDLMLRE